MDLNELYRVAFAMFRGMIADQIQDHETEISSRRRKIDRAKQTLAMLSKFEKELSKPPSPAWFPGSPVPARRSRK